MPRWTILNLMMVFVVVGCDNDIPTDVKDSEEQQSPANCVAECEFLAPVLKEAILTVDPEASVEDLEDKCQNFESETTCSDCNYELEIWITTSWAISTDCGCHFYADEIQDSEGCQDIIDTHYGGSSAELAAYCETCPSERGD